jgi:predicted Zn-dependent protease
LLGLFLVFHQQFVDIVAARVSPQLERQLGDRALAQIATTTSLITSGSTHAALARIAARVIPDSDYTYRFHLVDDDSINAFALPGGIVVVHTGLIAVTARAEELAGVLAHEVQHVELRHSLKAVLRAAGLSLLWSLVTGDLGATLAGQAADQLLSLKFSRDAEREADAAGLKLLVDRGIDPRGMVSFFATLVEQGDSAPPALLSTHPTSAERRAALAAQVANLAQTCCRPLAEFDTWPPH